MEIIDRPNKLALICIGTHYTCVLAQVTFSGWFELPISLFEVSSLPPHSSVVSLRKTEIIPRFGSRSEACKSELERVSSPLSANHQIIRLDPGEPRTYDLCGVDWRLGNSLIVGRPDCLQPRPAPALYKLRLVISQWTERILYLGFMRIIWLWAVALYINIYHWV